MLPHPVSVAADVDAVAVMVEPIDEPCVNVVADDWRSGVRTGGYRANDDVCEI